LDRIKFLEEKASELRCNLLTMIHSAQSGHPGGSLSISDIVAALYYEELMIDPYNPQWEDRDRVILSKGHCCPVLYTVLAMKGYIPFETIYTLRKLGSILQGHPDMNKVPGIDMTTGSLGQGLSVGIGMAIAAKKDKQSSRVFVIIGDGETNEGQIWEAAMCAAKYKLDNLVAIIDRNNLQNDDFCSVVMPTCSMSEKWRAFGWEVLEINGHNMEEILGAFKEMKKFKGKPICIVANTVKGKGVSFMENVCSWHGTPPDDNQYEIAIKDVKEGF
jgi:transketolase